MAYWGYRMGFLVWKLSFTNEGKRLVCKIFNKTWIETKTTIEDVKRCAIVLRNEI